MKARRANAIVDLLERKQAERDYLGCEGETNSYGINLKCPVGVRGNQGEPGIDGGSKRKFL